MPELYNNENGKDETRRCALVGVYDGQNVTEDMCTRLADELECLAFTAGAETVFRIAQQRPAPDNRTYIGKGKLEELSALCEGNDVDLVIFDDELTPSQIRNIEDGLPDGTDVIDRSMLILDIFARHAVTGEGKLQVELAQLRYSAPRLVGHGDEMSRQGAVGGNPIGTRGPGETQLERDRRRVRARIASLEAELAELERTRRTMRAARERSGIVRVSIVGYTNAGKSTLLNYLTDAGILAEDKLFATLDPTTRKYKLPSGSEILLTDTVGFIRKLPHHLISAFRSTLEEAATADIILIIIDASDPEYEEHIAVTENILLALGAEGKPVIYVFNKCDLPAFSVPRAAGGKRAVYISAKTGRGVDELLSALDVTVRAARRVTTFMFPASESASLAKLYRAGAEVVSTEYFPDGTIRVTATVDEMTRGQLSAFIV